MKAIVVSQPGGTEQLKYIEVPPPPTEPGRVLVRATAIGVNFIDVYFRTGLYKADPPFTPGMEAAGVVEQVGPDVTDFTVGERVAWPLFRGSYAEYVSVPSTQLVKIPAGIDDQTAAAVMLQGMTAHYLTRSTYPLKAGDVALVHAAAGGAGLLVVQLAKKLGARLIGTVSTEAKAAIARENGVDDVVIYTRQDFEHEVRRLTGGQGVDVVYDSVGAATYEKSLNCIRPRGMLVLFGQSSGPVPPFDPAILNHKGSLYLTRPSLGHYIADGQELAWRARELFEAVASSALRVHVTRTYPLQDAAQAHRDLEARETTGKLLLLPG